MADTPAKNVKVCWNCREWVYNRKDYPERYECKFNGRWGGCKLFVSKYSRKKNV